MAKNKLAKFEENLTFPHLFQPQYQEMSDFFLKGKWSEEFFLNQNPLILELGCGKGEYTVGLAQRCPQTNFIGMDIKGARLWRGCKTVAEEQMKNIAFVRTRIQYIDKFFASGEVDQIWITFPDPQYQKENKRLTSPYFLEKYRSILKSNGVIHLKTDDMKLYQYTLEDVVISNKHRLITHTDDLYAHEFSVPEAQAIKTFYEQRWLSEGKKIKYISFRLNVL